METFTEFKDSFSYGSRNNLNFKFLSHMTENEAANFTQELLFRAGMFLNDGDRERIIEHIVQGQIRAYSKPAKYTYEESPFTPFTQKLSEAKIGLLTSSGHFVEGDDPAPFGIAAMTQQEAIESIKEFLKEKPTLSVIPSETPMTKLRVRHGGYDISGVQADHGSAFPIETLKDLQQQGFIGTLAQMMYSFVGACAQGALRKEVDQVWMEQIKKQQLDAILLIPV